MTIEEVKSWYRKHMGSECDDHHAKFASEDMVAPYGSERILDRDYLHSYLRLDELVEALDGDLKPSERKRLELQIENRMHILHPYPQQSSQPVRVVAVDQFGGYR